MADIDLSLRRPSRVATLVALAVAAVAAYATYTFVLTDDAQRTRPVCGNGYCIEIPTGWRSRDASYPSGHTTYVYWNPDNALEQLTITGAGCIGCVTDDGTTPHLRPPGHAFLIHRPTPDELRYRTYEGRSEYPTEWLVRVTRADDGRIDGSFTLTIELPERQSAMTRAILHSFQPR